MEKESKYSIRHYENLHIPLWLLKDTCWMMEWRMLGMVMILPTVSVALYLTHKSFKTRDFYINLAVSFWISANAYWMCCEFFGHPDWKFFAAIPFGLGMVCTMIFYLSKRKTA